MRIWQAVQAPASGNNSALSRSNTASRRISIRFSRIHWLSSRTGMTCFSLVFQSSRKAASSASFCCACGSRAMIRAWPAVIWSARNTSAASGISSAKRRRPWM